VLTAATRRFADAVVGAGAGFRSVLAAYPWSGHQFLDPSVDETEIRVIMGDADEWCSPMQVQGHCQAIRLSGGRATMRLIGGAQHSFDRGTEYRERSDAAVSPAAPTAYIAHDGAFIHPLTGVADSKLVDRDLMIYALKAGYGARARKSEAAMGTAELFQADMLAVLATDAGVRRSCNPVIVPTSGPAMIGLERIVRMHEFRLTQISDTHLAAPTAKAHRQFSPGQRAHRLRRARIL
jgi:hypothetical protein